MRLAKPIVAMVEKDKVIAAVSHVCGRTIETIKTPVGGRMHTVAMPLLRDPGDMMARVLFSSKDPKCKTDC